MIVHSSYMRCEVGEVRENVEFCIEALKGVEYDFIACTGLSGMMVAAPVAYMLSKQLCIIRKDGDSKHAQSSIEGLPLLPLKYVIIDDFFHRGDTIINIASRLEHRKHSLVGIVFYHERDRRTIFGENTKDEFMNLIE